MKFSRNKTTATGIAFILMLSLTVTMLASLPTVKAVDVKTYAYCAVAPNPVGVNQEVTVSMWLDKIPPVDEQNHELTFSNYYLEITDPEGQTKTLGPFTSDWIASKYTTYTPTMVGTYYFQFKYEGETIYSRRSSGFPLQDDTYLPSTSQKMELTVQEEPIAAWPAAPLPTQYWQRPIEGQNREWYTLGGSWLGLPLQFATGYNATGSFNPYTTAPNTAHIVWTKPMAFGGIVGGELGTTDFYTGLSYEEKWNPPSVMIIAGRLYYHLPLSNWPGQDGLICVDLRTGEEYWQQDIQVNFAQLLRFDSPNQHGVIPYLWSVSGSTYTMYDAWTGKPILTIANGTGGYGTKTTFDESGNLIVYSMNSGQNWLRMWNTTKVEGQITLAGGNEGSWQWRPPIGATLDGNTGIQWQVDIPSIPGQAILRVSADVIVTTARDLDAASPTLIVAGYDAHTGAFKWSFNITDYPMIQRSNYNFSPIIDGVFCYFDQAEEVWYGYSADTGRKLWGPTEPYESPWGVYSQSYRGAGQPFAQVGYGQLYATAYDGTVHCFDLQTGENVWNCYTGSSGYETVYGDYPFYGGVTIADGKVYISSNEHSPDSPNWRGGKLYCIDAFNGTILWSVYGWMPGPVVADGYLAVLNSYDGQVYSFGKGLSAVTVAAPDVATTMGDTVLIKGTVTDQSPGDTCLGVPAAGTPAIADDYMSTWMEYLYMQKPMPTNATGVEVLIDVLDSNGNYRNIGSTTSDINGFFSYDWQPDIPGKFTVVARFEGSESYFASSAATSFTVMEQPEATPTPTPPPPSMADIYFLPATIGMIIAIIAVGLVIILMLRKR